MPMFISAVGILTLLSAMLLSQAVAAFDARQLTDNEQQRLLTGEVLVEVKATGESSAAITAAINISAQRDIVWQVMTDCAHTPDFVPGLKSCRVLTRNDDGRADVREHIVEWGWLLPDIRSVFRSSYDKPNSITFEKVDGDFSESSGIWRLESVQQNKATRIIYEARVSMPLVIPGSIVRRTLETDIPRTLKALRDEVVRTVQR